MTRLFQLNHLVNYPKFFLEVIAREYPLSVELILKYQHLWDWSYISTNEAIDWREETLQILEKKLIWANVANKSQYSSRTTFAGRALNLNNRLPWSTALIKKYIKKGKWQWDDLAFQQRILEDPKMLALCLPHWSENVRKNINPEEFYSDLELGTYDAFRRKKWGGDSIKWGPALVENCPNLDWDLFSGVQGFPWTLEFIKKHQNKLNWKRLSGNRGIPWSLEFLETFKEKLDWFWVNHAWKDLLSDEWVFPYTKEILEQFEDYIDWKEVSVSFSPYGYKFAMQWTEDLLIRFKDKIHWSEPQADDMGNEYLSLINDTGIYWTPELFNKLRPSIEAHFEKEKNKGENTMEKNEKGEQVYWTYYCDASNWSPELFELLLNKQKKEGFLTINWRELARSAKHLWSKDFIQKYQPKLISNIHFLCVNRSFPWNSYLDKWSDYLNKGGWGQLSYNHSLSISSERIEKYQGNWDWYGLSQRKDLTDLLIEAFKDCWNWKNLSYNPSVNLSTLLKYPEKADFEMISERKDLSEKNLNSQIIEQFKDRWAWYRLSSNKNIPLSYLYPCFERLSLSGILKREGLKVKDLDLSLPWKWENLGVWLDKKKEITKHLNDELVEEFLDQISHVET